MTAKTATTEDRPDVGYTPEGGGVVARCTACEWLAWKPTQREAETAASGHAKCRADDVKLVTRRRRARAAGFAW